MASPVDSSIHDDDVRDPHSGWPTAWPILLFGAFAALSVFVYSGGLQGAFVSDDYGYIVSSPYTRSLSAESVAEILNPWGQAKEYTVNYAPAHLLLTALERQIFANDVLGYHLVNVFVHALVSVLLVALLRASRIPEVPALLGGLFFLLHPANVEAVAWISQLKTNASLALTLGALLTFRRRPALSTLLFTLGILTKASAYAALPTVAALTWARGKQARGKQARGKQARGKEARGREARGREARERKDHGSTPRQWAWIAAWAVLFALYAIPEFTSIGFGEAFHEPAYDEPWVQLRSIAAVGARYLVMAATSIGVSAFQEPPPALSMWNPWWLVSLPLGLALLWRMVATLRNRQEEGAYWVLAVASFVPVSQVFPFVNPVADRYLYFILPGLIGAVILLGLEVQRRSHFNPGRATIALALVVSLGVAVLFGVLSHGRARLWANETRLLLDAVKHYPEGGTAAFFRARSAAQAGNVIEAVAALRDAERKNAARFTNLLTDPGLAPIRPHPDFQALVREMASRWIERAQARGVDTQPEYRVVALAHQVRQEYALALRAFESALEVGGLQDELVRSEIAIVRGKLAGDNAKEF